MVAYVVRRLLLAVLTVWAISVLSFMIIHLPPGDYVTSYIASMSASGSAVSEGEANALREQLGLDKPITVQYAKWMGLMLQGNFGMAMEWGRPENVSRRQPRRFSELPEYTAPPSLKPNMDLRPCIRSFVHSSAYGKC